MELYHTTDARGVSEINPDTARLREILDSLDEAAESRDAPHPDVSLVHHPSGWCLTVYAGGVVTFENLDEPDEPPLHLGPVSRREALALWQDLARGEIDRLRRRPWLRDEA